VTLARATDGFYHPASEAGLIELVQAANREGRLLRVRGAAHSVADAIYSRSVGPERGAGHQTAPDGDGIDVMLDRYREWQLDDSTGRVTADAGINLGVDEADPTHTSTLENSLLFNLFQKGLTLPLPGGITHQTAGGFTATGSCGGSLQHSSYENVHAFRVIDGRGTPRTFTRGTEEFHALTPNLGLLGVVSKVTFQCVPLFAVAGEESVQAVDASTVDLFGTGDGSLAEFLAHTEYGRIEWWPQRGVDRLVIWRAKRSGRTLFEERPYDRFDGDDDLAQQAIAVLYALLGNIEDPSRAKRTLDDNFDELERLFEEKADQHHLGAIGERAAGLVARAIEAGVDGTLTLARFARSPLRRLLPSYFPLLANRFVQLDDDRGGPQRFEDWSWRALPMDNAASDTLIPTSFTEAWIPLPRTAEVMNLLRGYFDASDDHEAYRRTGTFVWELYGAQATGFWLSPSYTSGDDEWQHGMLRVNPYWFADNADDPATTTFAGLWNLLRDHDIPFRLHWGKYQPASSAGDDAWVKWFAGHYPRWDDFLSLRAELDPNNIFLTQYWRDRLGLWDAAEPRPGEP
jgi:D-arabinono-1,4-lactone oxidase